ncbi:MAG: patatin-like phospholipase family protein [Methylocystis sp.]|uniref:patatin-like phospholipase family protein n=1 Tax=Methylocystis sp. TaxID=1911079 RepID=UPI003DA46986
MENSTPTKIASPREDEALAKIRADEARIINTRRATAKARGLCDRGAINEAGEPTGGSAPLTGLALSGGGVRSASVSLGAVQALHDAVGIEGVDYLSTVSGGGYLGCCLTAGLQCRGGKFPFSSTMDYRDTDAVRHIRDFSKYLVPNGWPDYLTGGAIFMRGLLANAILLAPLLLLAAWLTLSIYPNWHSLSHQKILWWDLADVAPAWAIGGAAPLWRTSCFAVTQNLLLIGLVILVLWMFGKSIATSSSWRSLKEWKLWEELRETKGWSGLRAVVLKLTFGQWDIGTVDDYRNTADKSAELTGFFPSLARMLFIVTAISAFFELQPFILQQFAEAKTTPPASVEGWRDALQLITHWLASVTPTLAPLGAAFAFLSKFLFKIEVLASHSGKLWVRALSLFTKTIWFFIGLIIPSFIWYLYLSLVEGGLQHDGEGSQISQLLGGKAKDVAAGLRERVTHLDLGLFFPTDETVVYFGLLLIFFVGALFINPNGTSFFRLYRDRLNKAFVFDPEGARDSRNDLRAAPIKLHDIQTAECPYPIINATLNLEGSQFANKRGRNADFFMFSPLYVGSLATNYVSARDMWTEERDLDLGTAMAISGAAVSPNMGSSTVRPLVATLALLNVRLG